MRKVMRRACSLIQRRDVGAGSERVWNPELVREYRARYDAVAQVEAAERQAMALEARCAKLNALARMAVALGVDLRAESPDAAEVWARWARLKAGAE